MKEIGFWLAHSVYELSDSYVKKVPKDSVSYDQAIDSLAITEQFIWDYTPKTEVHRKGDSYIVIQEKIDWVILSELREKDINIKVLNQLFDLREKFKKMNNEDYSWDITWYRSDAIVLEDKHFSSFVLEKIHSFRMMYNYILETKVFESSNIIVTKSWEVYFIDNVHEKWDQKRELSFNWNVVSKITLSKVFFDLQIKKIKVQVKNIL